MNLPLLGICYGHQLIVNKYGGKIKRANKEYGSSLLTIDNDKDLLKWHRRISKSMDESW